MTYVNPAPNHPPFPLPGTPTMSVSQKTVPVSGKMIRNSIVFTTENHVRKTMSIWAHLDARSPRKSYITPCVRSTENHPAKRRPYPRSVEGQVLPCVPGRGKGSPGSWFSRRRNAEETGAWHELEGSIRRRMYLAKTTIPPGIRRSNQSTPSDPLRFPGASRPLPSRLFHIVKPLKLFKKAGSILKMVRGVGRCTLVKRAHEKPGKPQKF